MRVDCTVITLIGLAKVALFLVGVHLLYNEFIYVGL